MHAFSNWGRLREIIEGNSSLSKYAIPIVNQETQDSRLGEQIVIQRGYDINIKLSEDHEQLLSFGGEASKDYYRKIAIEPEQSLQTLEILRLWNPLSQIDDKESSRQSL